ncbi:MAG: CoA transferase, partial [Betaproteobacteria bacterium]|nr:CoA transferase [Betaproteobacteria bacterium]
RTGKWIVDRGTVDAAGAVEPAASTMETPSPAGRITHLKPVVQLSETPPFWARPPVPLGHHRPVWP